MALEAWKHTFPAGGAERENSSAAVASPQIGIVDPTAEALKKTSTSVERQITSQMSEEVGEHEISRVLSSSVVRVSRGELLTYSV